MKHLFSFNLMEMIEDDAKLLEKKLPNIKKKNFV